MFCFSFIVLDGYRDAALRESVQPTEVQPPVDSDEDDPRPAAEDDEFFQAPDAQSKEEAINKFLDGIEGQECSGFKDIHRFLNHLPLPAGTESRSMPHADAMEGNFLPSMTAVNPWLWQFGRCKPRLGGLTVKENEYYK